MEAEGPRASQGFDVKDRGGLAAVMTLFCKVLLPFYFQARPRAHGVVHTFFNADGNRSDQERSLGAGRRIETTVSRCGV